MRKAIGLLFVLLALSSCREPSPGYRELEQNMLIRITGTWQTENGQITETWRMSRDSVFRATAFAAAGDMKNPVPEEYIRIVRDGEKTFYEAQVAGQNDEKPVLFRLTGLDTNRMVFTNPDHDFPRKIEYTLESPDRLNAIVSDGSTSGKSITFKYRKMKNPKKVTGIGGIFFKSKDPGGMRDWYRDKLGLATNEYGSLFEFRLSDEPERKGYLQWSPFTENTSYFQPSEKDFMINYRVENLEYLVEELRAGGVTILDSIEVYEYGKFIHILDPENNKIELWEPIEGPFTDNYEGKTTK